MKYVVIPFLAGLLVGGVLGRYFSPWHFYKRMPAGNQEERFLRRFSSELALSPTQKEEIRGILKSSREKTEKLLAEFRPKFDAIRASAAEEIKKLLSPEQQAKFDRLQEKHKRRMKKDGHFPY